MKLNGVEREGKSGRGKKMIIKEDGEGIIIEMRSKIGKKKE